MPSRARLGLWSLLAILVYVLSLRFLFPGYFDPLLPHHSDLYVPVGLLDRSPLEVATFPRPIAFLCLQAIGLLGVRGSILAVIVLVLAGVVGTAALASRLKGSSIAAPAFVLYATVLFAHPQFYFHHRHDFPAALSYLMLLAAVGLSMEWFEHRSRGALGLYLAVMGALALTKETYYVAALLLMAGVARWIERAPWRRIVRLVVATLAIEGAAFVYDAVRYRHYLAAAFAAGQPYSVSFAPASLLPTLWLYLKELAAPLAVLAIVVALAAAWRSRAARDFSLVCLAAAVASLVPHAALPGHFEAQYAWVGAPLLFAPLLLTPARGWRGWIALPALALVTAGWVVSNRTAYRSRPQQWQIEQERAGGRVLAALPAIAAMPARHIVVSGLRASYHPWLSSDFIRHRFGHERHWTVLVSRDGPQHSDDTVTLTIPARVNLPDFDAAVLFEENGQLQRILTGGALASAVRADPDEVLVPALSPLLSKLHANPQDFPTLLGVGAEYMYWGWPDRAIPYLESAMDQNGRNPYPHFFLAQAFEIRNDYQAARLQYERAIALDTPGNNPAFREALARLPSSKR